jgi:hypothetical protein
MKSQIFLTGPGRSGTTLTNYVLSLHPDITSINSWYAVSKKPLFNFLGERVLKVNFLRERFGKKKGFPRANEPLNLWKEAFHNFWNAVNLGEPLDKNEKDKFIEQVASIMKYEASSKSFMTKMTGPPFNGVLKELFPEAKIVWVDRDPRAVILSYIKMGWVGVERISAKEIKKMSKIELIQQACDRYNHYYSLMLREKFDYILYYEDIVENPTKAFTDILTALGLEASDEYLKTVGSIQVHENRNQKYDLTQEEESIMTNLLAEPLKARSLI